MQSHGEYSPLLRKVHQAHEISCSTRYYILGALWAGTFLCNVNLTMVATLLPSITSEFRESNQASWVGTAYLLSTCTFTPLYGRLCTILGRRAACQVALLATTVGTLFCGLSRGMIDLTTARFIAGIGAGALQLLAVIVSADMYTGRERGLPQAFSSLFQAAGLGLGGVIGGVLNDLFGWRVAFLCQVPLFLLVMIVIANKLHYVMPGKGQSAKEVLFRIDFGGLFALFLMLGSTLVWLSTKYNDGNSWSDPQVSIPLALSLFSLGLLFVVENYIASEPILPPFLLKQKVPILVCSSNLLMSACNFTVMYFIPLWFQTVALDSASVGGLHVLPDSIGMAFGSLVAGWLLHRTGKYTTLNMVFGIVPLFGCIPIVLMQEDAGFVQKWFSIVPVGLGCAVIFVTVLMAMQAHLEESWVAPGLALTQLFRALGQIVSVAIASAVFQSRLDTELHQRLHGPDAERLIANILHSLDLVGTLPPPLQRIVRDAYAASFKTVFIVATVSMVVSYLLRFPIPEGDIRAREGCAGRVDDDAESEQTCGVHSGATESESEYGARRYK